MNILKRQQNRQNESSFSPERYNVNVALMHRGRQITTRRRVDEMTKRPNSFLYKKIFDAEMSCNIIYGKHLSTFEFYLLFFNYNSVLLL